MEIFFNEHYGDFMKIGVYLDNGKWFSIMGAGDRKNVFVSCSTAMVTKDIGENVTIGVKDIFGNYANYSNEVKLFLNDFFLTFENKMKNQPYLYQEDKDAIKAYIYEVLREVFYYNFHGYDKTPPWKNKGVLINNG